MKRFLAAVVAVGLSAFPSFAHHLYLVPPSAPTDPLVVVWNEMPAADVPPTAALPALGTFHAVGADGKSVDLTADATKRTVAAPPADARAVYGTGEYGVSNRGEGQAFRLRYHAKLALAADAPAVGLPVEISPQAMLDGTAFVVTVNGKPAGSVEVTVFEPGADKPRTVKADPHGVTPTFSAAGRYSLRVTHLDDTPGELDGHKYRGTYHHSTLTCTIK